MAKSSAELQSHAATLGLDTSGTRDQLMCRIRDFVCEREKRDILPQIDVQNAQNGKEFLDYTLDKPWRSPEFMKLWNSQDWVFEPKLDGIRVKFHIDAKEYMTNPRLDSRRKSDVDYVYNEKTGNFPQFTLSREKLDSLPEEMKDCVLDGELIQPPGVNKLWNGAIWMEGLQIPASIWNSGPDTAVNLQQYGYLADGKTQGCWLHFTVFDVLRWNGEWVWDSGLTYRERRGLRQKAVEILQSVYSYPKNYPNPIYEIATWGQGEEAIQSFEKSIETGGEGGMFKNLNGIYELGKRSWDWIKLKKFVEISAFVTGSIPGTAGKGWENYIGAFQVSVMAENGTPVHIASVSGIDMETRKSATSEYAGTDGLPLLNPIYINKVMEIRFQQITSRNQRGRHAVMVRWRPDQTVEDCRNDQAGLKPSGSEMILEGESV